MLRRSAARWRGEERAPKGSAGSSEAAAAAAVQPRPSGRLGKGCGLGKERRRRPGNWARAGAGRAGKRNLGGDSESEHGTRDSKWEERWGGWEAESRGKGA